MAFMSSKIESMVRQGQARAGFAKLGKTGLEQVRVGSAPLCTPLFCMDMHGSAWLSLAQLGSAWLSFTQLGSDWLSLA